jgi:hypothetical protein
VGGGLEETGDSYIQRDTRDEEIQEEINKKRKDKGVVEKTKDVT